MKILKKILKIFMALFLISMLLIGTLSLILRTDAGQKIPFISDYKPVNVLGGSMEPTIKYGSLMIVKKVNPLKVKTGDIITYTPAAKSDNLNNKTLVTHRVVKLFKNGKNISFETKGDANRTSDGNKVKLNQLVGKVFLTIPLLGRLSFFSKSKNGFILLVLLPGLALIGYELFNLKKNLAAK